MKPFPYQFNASEEIVRWAFEVHVNNNKVARDNWFIAFTNPTAGPWKRVMAPDETGAMSEVARFGRDEERPDLVLASDTLHLTLIIEAKDDVRKLVAAAQMNKSINVIHELGKRLSESTETPWGRRSGYPTVSAFLWGGSSPQSEFDQVLQSYDRVIKSRHPDPVIGICVLNANGSLIPHMLIRENRTFSASSVVQSFGLLK